jgi:hypothetical protein
MKDIYIDKCIELIAKKQNHLPHEKWIGKELKLLSDNIYDKTKIRLSINTLKRIMGVIAYESTPAPSTKEALAKYLDYADWNDFLIKNFSISEIDYDRKVKGETPIFKEKKTRLWLVILTLCLLFGILFIWQSITKNKTTPIIDSSSINLTINPESGLTPLDILIDYQLADSNFPDTLYLKPENQGEYKLTKQNGKFRFKYLYPGKYNIDIAYNNIIIKRKPVFAKTNGWMAMVYRVPNTIYSYSINEKQGLMTMPDSIINTLKKENNSYYITFNNFQNFPVQGDHLRLKTRYRNAGANFLAQTGNMYINLFCDNGEVKTSFVNEGMLRNMKLRFAEHEVDFEKYDLSAFEKKDLEWINAEIIIRNDTVKILRSDSLIFSIAYTSKLGNLHGIEYFFTGNGAVDYIQLLNEKDSLLIDDKF